MEARAPFRGTGISKLFVVVIALCIAVGLGAMAASLSGKLSSAPANHQVSGGVVQARTSVLVPDQDRESLAAAAGALTPDAQDRNSQLAADRLQATAKTHRNRIPVGYF